MRFPQRHGRAMFSLYFTPLLLVLIGWLLVKQPVLFQASAQQSSKSIWQPLDRTAAATEVLRYQKLNAAPEQQTVELKLDDNSTDSGLLQDGLAILQRLTPTSYPATLQKIRVQFARFQNQPDPTGQAISLLIYTDPSGSGQIPVNAQLMRVNANVPGVSLSSFFEFTINNGPTLASGDFYVGYQVATPHQGVGFAFDTNNPDPQAQGRTFGSLDNGVNFVMLPPPTGGQSSIAMIRAVVNLPNVQAGPLVEVSPASLDFGAIGVGTTADRTLTIRNTGTAPLNVSNLTSSNPAFTLLPPSPPFTIAAGGQQLVGVRFTASAAGTQSGTLTLTSNDTLRPTLTVPVIGTGGQVGGTTVALTSGVAQTGAIAASQSGACSLGGTQYTIQVPSGAAALQLNLTGNQDVDLYVRHNSAVVIQAGAIVADFRAQSLSNTELVTITPVTIPALQAGTYYIGVGNCSTAAVSFTVTATVSTSTAGQITEELAVYDCSGESGVFGNGFFFFNRLTPSRYPSRLQRIRIFFAAFQGQPDPAGATIRLLAFNELSNNPPPTSPSFLVDRNATLPNVANARFIDFDIPDSPTITEGDWYIGFQSPNPYAGVICVVDVSSTSQGRTIARGPSTAVWQNVAANAMIRGVTLSGTQPTCNYAIAPTSQSFNASGGTGSVNVTVANGCNWTAVSNAAFITINSGATGSGNGTVNFTVAANNTTTQRTGTVTIAGQTFTVTQAGLQCTYTIAPTSQNFTANGGSGNVNVTALNGCAWTATSNVAFITINSGAAGNGNGTVNFSVAANSNTSARTGTLTVAGQTFTVSQDALACSYTIAPTSQAIDASGGNGSVDVTAANGCAWTATSNAAFITINNGAAGNGNGSVSYAVATNPTATQRTGTLTVAGQTFTVTQAGQACTYTIAPTNQSFAVVGGTGNVNVTALAGCNWTASSNAAFITINSGATGNGNAAVAFTVAANTAATPRTGTLTIAGQTFTVTQAEQCAYTIAPINQSFEVSGGNGTVNVTTTSACAWTATSNAAFITINSGANGTGNGAVNFTVAANSTTTARTGTLTVAGQTFTVTQAGIVCNYAIAPTSQNITATANTGSVNVTVNTGCTWTASSNAQWLTINSGASGNGNGTVSYAAAANPSVTARTGTLTLARLTFTVTQNGAVTDRLVRVAPVTGAGGSTVRIPIELIAQGDERALAFSLNYDPNVLRNPQATVGSDATVGNVVASQVSQGQLGLQLALPAGQSFNAGTRQAIVVTFNIVAVSTGQSTLSFGDQPVPRSVSNNIGVLLPSNYASGVLTIVNPVASVNAASFSATVLAPESIIAAFGTNLATRTESAAVQPLPTTLAGTTVKIRDSGGVERSAQLFFVAPGQVNYLMPAGLANGVGTVTVTSGDGTLSLGTVNIAAAAPGLFTANASGQGLAVGVVLRVRADSSQVYETLVTFDNAQQRFVAVPIDVSNANDQVFVLFFGTGLRGAARLSDVNVQVGGTNSEVGFAGPQGDLAGLDQLNVRLSRTLMGRGEVDVVLNVAGRSANVVKINIR